MNTTETNTIDKSEFKKLNSCLRSYRGQFEIDEKVNILENQLQMLVNKSLN